jgi:TonB family protein
MKKVIVSLVLSFFSLSLFSQGKTTVEYYRNIELTKKTIEKKAQYKVISALNNNDLIEELFEINTNKIIWHKSFRDGKPFGEWYSFDEKNSKTNMIVYGKYKPQNFYSYDLKDQKLVESIEGEFIKPKLIVVDENIKSYLEKRNASEITVWIAFNVRYPLEAMINGIQGEVKTQFTIDENGEIDHIMIIEGVNEILDAEAYRLLRSMPKMQPARLNGKAINLYIETPINFLLR